ncbi:MAG: PIN domain-containing protein [Candidatus Thermoplasmatota archaeon]|nr:PIN domain-containing protein [Candidatus Thermoplasmatota archaeon]
MIILNDAFDFIAPEYLLIEVEKYREYLMKKAHQNEREFDLTLSALIESIYFVPTPAKPEPNRVDQSISQYIFSCQKNTNNISKVLRAISLNIWLKQKRS